MMRVKEKMGASREVEMEDLVNLDKVGVYAAGLERSSSDTWFNCISILKIILTSYIGHSSLKLN